MPGSGANDDDDMMMMSMSMMSMSMCRCLVVYYLQEVSSLRILYSTTRTLLAPPLTGNRIYLTVGIGIDVDGVDGVRWLLMVSLLMVLMLVFVGCVPCAVLA